MNSSARPRSRRSSSRIAITSAWVVTSSAVVGSSASSSRGSVEQRGGDHDALQQPAGQLVRVLLAAAARRPRCRPRRARRPRAGAASRARHAAQVRSASVMKSPIRAHRVDVRARVLEDHRHLARGTARSAPPRQRAARRAPSKRIAPVDLGARRQQPRRSRARSSTCPSPTRRPGRRASPAPIAARRRAAPCAARPPRAAGREALDLEQRAHATAAAGDRSRRRRRSSIVEPRPLALERGADAERRHVVVRAAGDLHAGRHAVVGEAGRHVQHRQRLMTLNTGVSRGRSSTSSCSPPTSRPWPT